MIGMIKGVVREVRGNVGLVETKSGIFFEVFLQPSLLNYERKEEEVKIYTHLAVREDSLTLFGFETRDDVVLFKLLISVSGVGPKLAFSIMSFLKREEIIEAIKNNDTLLLSKVPGLGKKTAMKIIVELSAKLSKEVDLSSLTKEYLTEDDKIVIDALVSLGFRKQDVKKTVVRLDKSLSIEERIRKALTLLK